MCGGNYRVGCRDPRLNVWLANGRQVTIITEEELLVESKKTIAPVRSGVIGIAAVPVLVELDQSLGRGCSRSTGPWRGKETVDAAYWEGNPVGGVDLVVGIGVGGFLGWTMDRYLGTGPWGLIIFLLLGFAAGMINVIRAANKEQARHPVPKDAPRVKDDEDDDR